MKFFKLLFILIISGAAWSQQDSTQYRVVLQDGTEFMGQIISQDARELLIRVEGRGELYIPQYVIKEINTVVPDDYNQNGEYVGEDVFATRYFITTNGLNIKRGDHYVQWNLYGPDFQFAVTDRLGIGVMTSWLAMPIVLNAKYSFQSKGKFNFAVGGLLGTGSWGAPDWGMALPFATIGYGNRKTNVAFSAGYGAFLVDNDKVNHPMTGLGFLTKLSKRFSLVFDGFFVLPAKSEWATGYNYVWNPNTQTSDAVPYQFKKEHPGLAVIVPGLRWNVSSDKAFQFGFSGIYADGAFMEVPIPMVQWFRKL